MIFYALRSVHQSGVLHRDVKLNNVGFRIRHPRSSSSSSPVFVRADGVRGVVDSRLSACMLDFGEAVPLRVGQHTACFRIAYAAKLELELAHSCDRQTELGQSHRSSTGPGHQLG
jgi:serine/threonine protein kinase